MSWVTVDNQGYKWKDLGNKVYQRSYLNKYTEVRKHNRSRSTQFATLNRTKQVKAIV